MDCEWVSRPVVWKGKKLPDITPEEVLEWKAASRLETKEQRQVARDSIWNRLFGSTTRVNEPGV